jgi:hypothetical protein
MPSAGFEPACLMLRVGLVRLDVGRKISRPSEQAMVCRLQVGCLTVRPQGRCRLRWESNPYFRCVLGLLERARENMPCHMAGFDPATVVVTRALARRQRIERCTSSFGERTHPRYRRMKKRCHREDSNLSQRASRPRGPSMERGRCLGN